MTIEELQKFNIQDKNINLYFMTKKNVYSLFSVEIDEDLQKFFKDCVISFLQKNSQKNVSDFNSENEDSLLSLNSEKANIFYTQVCSRFGKINKKFDSLQETKKNGDIIAYCISVRDEQLEDNFYAFRKVSKTTFGKDENGSKKHKKARFDTTTGKLLTETDSLFSFDDNIDFIYKNNEFIISNKANFEILANYYEVYHANAASVLASLDNSGQFIGIPNFSNTVDKNKNYQKRLSKIFDLENYNNLNIKRMEKVASKYGKNLKIEDSKVKLEDASDYDLLCKLLGDYYKTGEVSGESYGTFAGELLKK